MAERPRAGLNLEARILGMVDTYMPVAVIFLCTGLAVVSARPWLTAGLSVGYWAANVAWSWVQPRLLAHPRYYTIPGYTRAGLALICVPPIVWSVGPEAPGWALGILLLFGLSTAMSGRAVVHSLAVFIVLTTAAFAATGAPMSKVSAAAAALVCASLLCVPLMSELRRAFVEQEQNHHQLTEAAEAARAASMAKSQFLANMSHELRTPLAGVIGLVDLAAAAPAAPDSAMLLKNAKEAAQHLLQILNDILDLSKIESGRLELENIPFDMMDVIDKVVMLTRVNAEAKGLTVEVTHNFSATNSFRLGDPLRLRQVLLNLTSNAVKFTTRGTIALRVESSGGSLCTFAVSDTGIGMSADQASRLFEPFTQGDQSTARRFGGTGLGLTISRRLARAMGGDIVIKTQLGEGSTFAFTVQLPTTEPPPAIAALESRGSTPTRSLRLLVAEDNRVNQLVIRRTLESLGHQVEIVGNGSEAITSALASRFDLILMDVQMPVCDGLEATRSIRIEEKRIQRNTPIVALTANVNQGIVEECLAAGVDEYLNKPVERDRLVAVLERLTSQQLTG